MHTQLYDMHPASATANATHTPDSALRATAAGIVARS
jgi:hypothetical protein